MSAADVVRRWADAVNQRDPDAVVALYAPNAVVRDPQYDEPLEGRDAIRQDMESFFGAFPDLRVQVSGPIEADGTFAFEGVFTGTQEGPLPTDSGEIPPSGKRMELRAAGFYRLDGQDRILEEHRYFDLAGLLAQLGATT